jgi:hypothetical protein
MKDSSYQDMYHKHKHSVTPRQLSQCYDRLKTSWPAWFPEGNYNVMQSGQSNHWNSYLGYNSSSFPNLTCMEITSTLWNLRFPQQRYWILKPQRMWYCIMKWVLSDIRGLSGKCPNVENSPPLRWPSGARQVLLSSNEFDELRRENRIALSCLVIVLCVFMW